MEDHTKKTINKSLSNDERAVLYEMMSHPGWDILKKINKVLADDWIQQTAHLDMSNKTDEEMVRLLRHRQGQIKGMDLVLSYLDKKKLENTRVGQDKESNV